jgi:hypothetical protein
MDCADNLPAGSNKAEAARIKTSNFLIIDGVYDKKIMKD